MLRAHEMLLDDFGNAGERDECCDICLSPRNRWHASRLTAASCVVQICAGCASRLLPRLLAQQHLAESVARVVKHTTVPGTPVELSLERFVSEYRRHVAALLLEGKGRGPFPDVNTEPEPSV